jgi:HAD superfamily hydrolase (TIGR01509 family)
MLRAALLDIDGTLVDSNNAHAKAWVEALEAHGISVPFSKVRPMIGMGGDKVLPALASVEEDSVHGKAIAKTRDRIFRENYLPTLEAFPEVRALLQRLSDAGLRLIVATSAGEDLVDGLLDRAHVKDLIEGKTTSDDAESSKPSPDIIEAALKRYGLNPEETIMIGDTPYDVEAAKRAGVSAIAFESGGWGLADFAEAKAVYRDAADLLARFESSIFAKPELH